MQCSADAARVLTGSHVGDGLDGIDWTPLLVSNWLNASQTQTLVWVVVGLQVFFEPVSSGVCERFFRFPIM